ncbi:outer membrane beta-barrel protein [Agarivorans sp. DSG3-1]|uniref:outer membrane beta-barrel protein n=1 Tax=Agarivorans sp. DSG3-1 TaxID=3342249 RepID=UPI00398F2553
MPTKGLLRGAIALLAVTLQQASMATEFTANGILDLRASQVNSTDSYLKGGFGKFAYSNGSHLSIAQAGLDIGAHWDNGFAAKLVLNGWLDNEDSALGFSEAFASYKGLPSENGLRWSSRLGIMYPSISLENTATAWATPYTLNASSLNTWLGEEIRTTGIEAKLERIGKFSGSSHNLSLSAMLFVNNDPAGALLAWHGWTSSSRQTLYGETRSFPELKQPALSDQSQRSNPFKEIDYRPGYHTNLDWSIHRTALFRLGYYDNMAKPYLIDDGDYAWRTQFAHLGGKWRFAKQWQLVWQYMNGSTLMQSPDRVDAVNMDFANGFVLLSRSFNKKHRVSVRAEAFRNTDLDNTPLDNNNERGKGFTCAYQYRVNKNWFLAGEYQWLSSQRPQRVLHGLDENSNEQLFQLAARYFFSAL